MEAALIRQAEVPKPADTRPRLLGWRMLAVAVLVFGLGLWLGSMIGSGHP